MLIRHGMVYLVARLGAGVLNLMTILLYTNLLSTDQYGRYALLLAAIGIINNIATGWLGEGVLRFASSHGATATLLRTVWKLQALVLSLASLVAVVMIVYAPTTEWKFLIGVGIGILWLQSTFDIRQFLFRARLRPDKFLQANLVRSVLTPIVGWSAISLGLGAVGAAVGYFAGLLASSVLTRSEQTPNRGTDLGSGEFRARQLLEYGVPLSLNSLMLQVVHSSDRFLIALLLGESAAGVYAAAYDLTQQTIALFLRATANASVPLIFKAALENEQKRLESYLRENLALLLTIGIAGIALFWEVVPALVSRLIGAAYRESLPLLMPIIAAATVAVGLRTHHFLLPLMIKEKTVLAVPASFVAMLTKVLANLWLLPRMGLLGAALATLMGYAVLLVITGLQTRRLMPTIQSSTDVVSIFAVGVLFAMVLRALPAENEWQSLRNGLLGGILYLTGLFALNVAGWRENVWRWIKAQHRR